MIKRYNFSKTPRKPSKLLMKLVRLIVVPIWLQGQKVTVEKIGMEGIESPYLLFCTHSGQLDYPVLYRAIAPESVHCICALSGVRDVGDFLLSRLGCFYKRTFVNEITTIRHTRTCLNRDKSVMCIFPESRYSFDGTLNPLPGSLGKTAKLMKKPVAVLRMHGSYLSYPQWNKTRRHPPIRCEIELVATPEETQTLSAEELQDRIERAMRHDDFAYQRENKIRIAEPDRAEGLENVLYRCRSCGREYEMYSEGATLRCKACGRSWELSEYGDLVGEEGVTQVSDWFRWEREEVRKEVREGRYRFEDEVEVRTLPHYKKFYAQGRGKLVQTCEETVLGCVCYGEKKELVWKGLEGVHIEFDYPSHKRKRSDNRFGDCIEISTAEDSYWLSPVHGRCRIMKFSLATEEIYAMLQERRGQKSS